jgi:Coenzyme PQQ synthesis protein D (PqqD)
MTDQLWVRRDNWVGTQVEDQFVMVNVDGGEYVSLNSTATAIWNALEQPVSEQAIVERLRGGFEVEPEQCAAAVSRVLGELEQMQLVEAFGLDWASDLALPHFANDSEADAAVDIRIERIEALSGREPLRTINRGAVHKDGFELTGDSIACFEMSGGGRIGYAPGPQWRGELPLRFYSTVIALTCAWRGAIPLHASAVAIDGRAWLLCGATGAGKSTLSAALLAHGAEFIGDDLTMIDVGGGGASVPRGRTTMRLHPDTARWIPASSAALDTRDGRGKWLVEPLSPKVERWPLAGFVLVGVEQDAANRARLKARVAQQMFRPRWLEALPGHPARVAGLFGAAAGVPILALPTVAITGESDFRELGKRAMDSIRSALA